LKYKDFAKWFAKELYRYKGALQVGRNLNFF
jgi:hypothetical protein